MIKQKKLTKITAVFFYMLVIYHLLPFSPIALYYTGHHPPADMSSWQAHRISKKTPATSVLSFVTKDKNSLDVDHHLFPAPSQSELTFSYKKVFFPVLNVKYFNPVFLHCSGRGPPSFFS